MSTSCPTPALGAVWDGDGVTFRLFSAHADAVELCLFERVDSVADRHVALERGDGGVWRRRLTDVGPGQLYGYRVHGPFKPQEGHLFNPSKLLVDPYARAITGEPRWSDSLLGFPAGSRHPGLAFDSHDSAGAMPKCVVVAPGFDWQGVEPPRTPWRDTVIYEAHVKGLTRRHPDVPEALRGTYLGLAQRVVIEHLLALGVTAVELMPVFQAASERHLLESGRRNYWGYSPLGFFAPHAGYATGGPGEQVTQFQTMVRELHRAGLEVILDVVFNHTPEGGLDGPTYSLKGLDNRSYYRLDPRNPRHYVDFTGCGNTLDIRRPPVLALVLDSLRYWVETMGVDGFRFDLAPVLGRDGFDFQPHARLFEAVAEDPLLSRVKMIAEPWDLGPGGYRLGQFPGGWGEWNDRFRDTVRRFWRGEARGTVTAELATRLSGSEDVFHRKGPLGGVNYVASHDGFPLADLVSYERKHNHANGENNRDGHGHNLSRNWGVEGPSDDPAVVARRDRARRNLLATVALAQGVPMLGHGDEMGRTQRGNNNAYCQDNELTWVDWAAVERDAAFLDFARRLFALRRRFPTLRRHAFLRGRQPGRGRASSNGPDVVWLGPSAEELDRRHWTDPDHTAFAQLLAPATDGEPGLWLAYNGGDDDVRFHLPEAVRRGRPRRLLDTARPEVGGTPADGIVLATEAVDVEALSLVVVAWEA